MNQNFLKIIITHYLLSLCQSNDSLTTLQLANCDLNLSTIVAISTSLASNVNVTSLNLDRPILSTKQEESADHLSRVLGYHPTLQSLSLRHGRISCHGCLLFSQELVTNTSLLSLNLEWYDYYPYVIFFSIIIEQHSHVITVMLLVLRVPRPWHPI